MTTLDDIYTLMNSRLSKLGTVVVAGGAVRDTLMERQPKDYDVFILGNKWDPAVAGDLAKELTDNYTVLIQPEWHKSEPYLVSTVRVLGEVVQVMLSPYTTVDALLDSFDWNVCLFAYDGQFHQRTELSAVAEGEPMELQKITFPLSTLRRGFRFSERFGMHIKHEDLVLLMSRALGIHTLPDVPEGCKMIFTTAIIKKHLEVLDV